MDLTLVAINDTLDWAGDDASVYDYPPVIRFVGHIGETKVLDVTPEQGAKASAWAALAAACEDGSRVTKDWGPENGEMRITVLDSEAVVFTVAKSGDWCGGEMKCLVKASCCAGAFREAARLTEEWLGALNSQSRSAAVPGSESPAPGSGL